MITKTITLLFLGLIQIELNVPLLCPATVENGCMNTGKIRDLNQRDYRHSKNPWRYQCLECERFFYAHTSKLFRQLAIRQQLQIMFRIAKCGSKLSDIATEFGISEASASKLASKFRSFVKNRLRKKYGYYVLYQNIRKLQTTKSQSVITDETFVRIGKEQYYIIVAINGYGEIICWKLVESREYREIAKLLFLLFEEMHELSLLVTDAFGSYVKALKHMSRDLNLVHVQHIHKQPRGSVRIRYVEKDQDARACIEYEWLTQSQVFKKYQQATLPAASSYLSLASARLTLFRISNYSENVRRKIRQQRKLNHQIQFLRERHECCGKSRYYNEGQVFLFRKVPLNFEISFNGHNHTRPHVSIVDPTLIDDTIANCNCIATTMSPFLVTSIMQLSQIYRGKSITSNLIESIFGQLDLAIPRSGNHEFETYDAVFSTWFAMVGQTIDLIKIAQAEDAENILTEFLQLDTVGDDIYHLFSRSSVYSLNNLTSGIEIRYWDNDM